MTQSELNHLRLLLGWVRCEIGQDPAEMVAMVKDFAARGLDMDNDHARQALVAAHDQSRRVPKYVRAAVKALEKRIGSKGEVSDAEPTTPKLSRAGSVGGGVEK